MIVLGLNGWPTRSHDASACVVVDGAVTAFCEEERLIRKKHAYDAAPIQAAQWCLAASGITLSDVDTVAVGWDLPHLYTARSMPWGLSARQVLNRMLPSSLLPRRRDPRLQFVSHHIAHAASAYYHSVYDKAAVMVVDGQGEEESSSIGYASGGEIHLTGSFPPAWSLGYFYEAVCQFVGLRTNDPGKLMGLAGHGHDSGVFDGEFALTEAGYSACLNPEIRADGVPDEQGLVVDAWQQRFAKILPVDPNYRDPRGATRHDPFAYRDIAASAQQALEAVLVHTARRAVALSGLGDIVMAGGVCLNASANAKILAMPEVNGLFIQPVAHDAGVSLGAALHVASQSGDTTVPIDGSVAWGPSFDDGQIASRLAAIGVHAEQVADPAVAAANLVASGKVVGWHQGAAEAGPRALGHRSILADPRTAAMRDHINANVKSRELWRPLAPSIARECSTEYLGSDIDLPYMIIAQNVRDDTRTELEAVVHADGSTRPQTVDGQTDPLYHRLLTRMGERTGKAAVLNTSFNGRDEPIVGSPEDALRTMNAIPIDALVIGSFVVHKQ